MHLSVDTGCNDVKALAASGIVGRVNAKIHGMPQKFRKLTTKQVEITARLRYARKKQGLTAAQMAAILDVSESTYKSYEWRTLIRADYLWQCAAATKTSVEFILTGRGVPDDDPLLVKYRQDIRERLDNAESKVLDEIERVAIEGVPVKPGGGGGGKRIRKAAV